MASMDSSKDSTPVHDLQTDPEKVAGEFDFGSKTERSPESVKETIPEDAAKVTDAGPPDGGTAAWLNVLGAWCCSFSSPGWANSMYLPSSQCFLRLPLCGFQ
jgi:hypothetical protein